MNPSDKLEYDAFHDCNTKATCYECGAEIDVEQDDYLISRDGERFCCGSCDVNRLHAINHGDYWGGYASNGSILDGTLIEVSVQANSREEALKKAEDYGEMINEGVNAYVEVR